MYPPSLRVASKCGACGVALLAKGTTLGFVPQEDFLRGVARLAVIRIWRQRVSCGECQQTLEKLTKLFNRKPSVSNNTTQRKCIDWVVARDGQNALTITHNDVFTLTQNSKSSFF